MTHPLLLLGTVALFLGTACGGAAMPYGAASGAMSVQYRSPIDFGQAEVSRALAAAQSPARVHVTVVADPAAAQALASAGAAVDARPEAYAVISNATDTLIVGRDETGAMYGALDVAERLGMDGAAALPLREPVLSAPATPIRGANLFLVFSGNAERDWWFLHEEFWAEYLDMLARSRMNFLDLHGMYNLDNTLCPNALLYFATSARYPDVGAPPEERERNVRMLAHVVDMARQRGIRVGLMSYRSDLTLTGDKQKTPKVDLGVYTREAVRNLSERVPGLWRLGFRIGESKHPASWYRDTFVAGVSDARSQTQLITRTWQTKKDEIMELVTSSDRDTMVEAKYNGEQSGPPYVVAGGVMARPLATYTSYSYEDYLDDPAPYTFLFHIWAGGTNRLFRYASYDRIRRTVMSTTLASARGFSLMASHAFYPQNDFYHADPRDRFSPWAFRRDELEYMLFGRLGYDPQTPERPFRAALARRTGTDALWPSLQAASDITPWIQTANTCGPDQRWFAPEEEWGGSVRFWATPPNTPEVKDVCHTEYHGPFDVFAVASPYDAARDLVDGRATSRVSPLEVARLVLDDARRAAAAAQVPIDPNNPEARDVVRESIALAHLGEYFGHKLRGATALAVFERTGRQDYLAEARSETALADQAWRALSTQTAYIAPFDEKLRMGQRLGFTPTYHWSMQRLDEDPASIEEVVGRARREATKTRGVPAARAWLDTPRGPGPGLARLDVVPVGGGRYRASATFGGPVPPGAAVRILHKGLSGLVDWETTEARGAGATFGADVTLPPGRGGFFAVEIEGTPGVGWRYPDAVTQTPYQVVLSGR